ncbi:MAG TPA: hypothetical protein VL832_20750 [Puia sp.]|nr:hypothetical protein [Puia sp.]
MTRTIFLISFLLMQGLANAQTLREYNDSVVLSNSRVTVTLNTITGRLTYRFANGITLDNTIAYVEDIHAGLLSSTSFSQHPYSVDQLEDSLGKGIRVNIKHMDDGQPLYLLQHLTLYADQPYLLLDVEAGRSSSQGPLPETRNIAPLAVLPHQCSRLFIPGSEPRILDLPFDNDDWVGVVERKWGEDPSSKAPKGPVSGISYECAAVYDNATMSGLVIGSLSHDFWKTGLAYRAAADKGTIDSFTVFGGAATPDNPSLPHAYGGQDGTHDHAPHGTMIGATVHSSLIYLCGLDIRPAFKGYGEMNARLNGRLTWKGYAPVIWNSFGVEGVLGYEKVMMPPGVGKISDFIHTLDNFNKYAAPVLSIDSYDQSIYTTELLASLSKYGKKQHQQMGFYFIPFATWTWRNAMDRTPVAGTEFMLKDVILKDKDGNPIAYKDGDWGAFPMDPTHPATRLSIINQLLKAKAIHATYLKIDFLSAGALESSSRYDPSVRSGLQAYNQGMKMLKHLIDSILGPDIFISQAISPMFPHQYTHTRFNSTDVYSHLRDDQPGFPNWGSTEASLASGSHFWWVQGTLWPYTNLDVCVMKNFQKNPDLSEQEIKVRLYAMMVMGSILGDGSDFRQPLAAERARKFLNNAALCAFFSHPQAFTPLQFADGDSFDQQLAFYLKTDTPLLALFNFSNQQEFKKTISLETLSLPKGKYILKDFMTDAILGAVENNQVSLAIPAKDAWLMKIVKE